MSAKTAPTHAKAELDWMLAALTKEYHSLDAKWDKLQKQRLAKWAEVTAVQEQIDAMRLAEPVDVAWLLTCHPESTPRYKALGAYLATLHLHHSCYHPETNQYRVQIRMGRNYDGVDHTPALIEAGLRVVLPYLLPLKADGKEVGSKVIGVMEHTLSAGGTYSLHIDEDKGEYSFVRVSYSRPHLVYRDKTLRGLLEYVYQRHPGENPNGED